MCQWHGIRITRAVFQSKLGITSRAPITSIFISCFAYLSLEKWVGERLVTCFYRSTAWVSFSFPLFLAVFVSIFPSCSSFHLWFCIVALGLALVPNNHAAQSWLLLVGCERTSVKHFPSVFCTQDFEEDSFSVPLMIVVPADNLALGDICEPINIDTWARLRAELSR